MDVLVTLLIFLVVAAIAFWILSLLPIPQPAKNIVTAVVLLIILIVLLQQIGVFGGSRLRLRD